MKKLRIIRKNKMLTQEALARLSGVHRVSIARYEEGRSTPNTDTACKLANALGCTIDELISADNEEAKGLMANAGKAAASG